MTLQLLIWGGKKGGHIECEGQLELPKQPPFVDDDGRPISPGPAAVVILELGVGSPNLAAMFDGLYHQGYEFNALAWDGGPAIRARMRCVEINWERGLQVTRPWNEPLRRASLGEGDRCVLYRPTPRHQHIKGVTNRYVLAADVWEPVAVPESFKKRRGLVEVH